MDIFCIMVGWGMLLVVDDQPAIRQLLFEALTNDGFSVELASNGREALAKVKQETPELILLDLKMPGMSGLETLREIHKISPNVPVILITAYGELSDPGEAERMGVRCLILKPFDLNDVRKIVRKVLAYVSA
ncbi:response regulator [Desulforudis sp. DRI-14]|uniref:response regulator n=1 Tax=Desulforudis sp. DRI-14 TaxID=3459793 RepID=UPI0040433FB2